MYRSSSPLPQKSLFSSIYNFLSGKSLKDYEGKTKWHNQFRSQVIERIDETILSPLFSEKQGAPNAPLRVLVGMMILKESQSWSDSQLFEYCQYNLLVRSALGLVNMDDYAPSPSTYYLLRKRIVEWEIEHNDNLLEKIFSQITKSHIFDFQISGKNIRMDSKLIGSNIAWYSRYELIHETVSKAYVSLKGVNLLLSDTELNLLKKVCDENGNKVTYRSNKSELETKMVELGMLIYKIICQTETHQTEAIIALRRIFNEQYVQDTNVVTPRPKSEISACSVQSPHDTDCHYRQKDTKKVKGYSFNVAETCDKDNKLNLITNVLVETASAADCNFLIPAIEATSEIITDKIETANADGAYHSVVNQDYCNEKDIDLVIGAIQGKPARFDLSVDGKDELIVTDLQTDTVLPSRRVESRKKGTPIKWRVQIGKNKYRYFTQKEINTCLLRKQIATRTQTELNVRNNVEATIFQLGYHYSNAKSRYRSLIKHKIWANLRCLWINFIRILKFTALTGSNCARKVKNSLFLSYFYVKNIKYLLILFYFFIFKENYFKSIKILSDSKKYHQFS
jgi:hypothetical protein